jgi:hypothetical protein
MHEELDHLDRIYGDSDIQVISAIAFIKLQQFRQSQENEDVISRLDEQTESTTTGEQIN